MGAQEEGAIITILVTASQYGLSHVFTLSLYCCLLAFYKNSCQYQVAAEKSETPAGKGAGLFHWWRERGGLRAHRWKKRVRRASAMLARWGIKVFLGHCDPRKELTGMPLGHHYHCHLMLVWPHFHRSRLFNSRVKRNYTWTAGRAQPADRAVSYELYFMRVLITQKSKS